MLKHKGLGNVQTFNTIFNFEILANMYLRSFRVKALSLLCCSSLNYSRFCRAGIFSRQGEELVSRQDKEVVSRQDREVVSRQDREVVSRQDKEVVSRQDREVVSRQGYVTLRMSPRFCPSTICHPRLGRSLTLLYILTIF